METWPTKLLAKHLRGQRSALDQVETGARTPPSMLASLASRPPATDDGQNERRERRPTYCYVEGGRLMFNAEGVGKNTGRTADDKHLRGAQAGHRACDGVRKYTFTKELKGMSIYFSGDDAEVPVTRRRAARPTTRRRRSSRWGVCVPARNVRRCTPPSVVHLLLGRRTAPWRGHRLRSHCRDMSYGRNLPQGGVHRNGHHCTTVSSLSPQRLSCDTIARAAARPRGAAVGGG